jgi:hypothetical protein
MIVELLEAATLDDVAPAEVWQVQYQALIRMQLYFTGETHRLLKELARDAQRLISATLNEAEVDGLALHQIIHGIDQLWAATYQTWKARFEALRREAAAIAFGGLVVIHEQIVRPALRDVSVETLTEAALLTEATVNAGGVFAPQIQALLDAANRRVYADGIPLSTRLWKLDQQTRAGIQRVIYEGVANKQSAWNMAKQLEQYLGFGADCPRWTSTRLRLTKKQIAAGDVRGLKRGEECRGQGVAYNALRLARNELQVMHAMATDEIMAGLPFVEKEQIHLSPSHPVEDECDQVIADGENGEGIYPKGTIRLGIHVQCLCFKTAVLPKLDAFTDDLRGWMNGTQPSPALDQYQAMVGGDVTASLLSNAVLGTLLRWAFNPNPGRALGGE